MVDETEEARGDEGGDFEVAPASSRESKSGFKKEDIIIEAKSFFDFHKKELGESLRKGQSVIFLDFMKLTEFSNKLAEEIFANPEETLRMIELAIEESGLVSNVRVRLNNLPKSQEITRALHRQRYD